MKIPILDTDEFDEVAARAARGFSESKIQALKLIFVERESLIEVSEKTGITVVSLRQSCTQFLRSYIKNVYVPAKWEFQSMIIEKSELKALRSELTNLKETAFLQEAKEQTKKHKTRTI